MAAHATRPTDDPRVLLLEALWKDEEFRELTTRVVARLFPESTDIQDEILRALEPLRSKM